MKYILYIDYKANSGKSYEYRAMTAKNLIEAITEADEIHNPETMYLIRIMEKIGKVEKENNYKVQYYKAIMCKRSDWHLNNPENCENIHFAKRSYNNKFECIEIF